MHALMPDQQTHLLVFPFSSYFLCSFLFLFFAKRNEYKYFLVFNEWFSCCCCCRSCCCWKSLYFLNRCIIYVECWCCKWNKVAVLCVATWIALGYVNTTSVNIIFPIISLFSLFFLFFGLTSFVPSSIWQS